MKNWLTSALIGGTLLLAGCGAVATPPTIANTTVPALGKGGGSFDVVAIDQAAHRLYAADRTDGGVDVFDVATPTARYLKTIPVGDANGIAVAPDLRQVFVGGGSGVTVIDVRPGSPTADKVIKQIATGTSAVDLIDYAPSVQRVFASNGAHGTISVIDTSTDAVTAVFKVGYALEQPRFNTADGTLYVTSPDAGAMFQLDVDTGKIKNKIALASCGTGLAINPKLDQALVACAESVALIDLRNPTSVSKFLDVTGGDVVTYDQSVDRFLIGAPDAKPSTVGIFGGNPIAYITSVDTKSAGNSAAYDETNHIVYTPETRPGRAGLDGFTMPSGEPTFSASYSDIVIFAGVLLAVAVLMVLIGRGADPIRRPEPVVRRRRRA